MGIHCSPPNANSEPQHFEDAAAIQQFQVLVSDYIVRVFAHYHPEEMATEVSQMDLDEFRDSAERAGDHSSIVEYLSLRVMHIVQDIRRTAPDRDVVEDPSRDLPLVFVKCVHHVLSADACAKSEVDKLRKVRD